MTPRSKFLLVLAALLLAALPLALSRGVWAPDEARYARVAAEMKAAGQWLVPSLNGDLYAQKPPLLFDLTQLASLGSEGIPEWAVKVPVLMAALLALWCVGLLGRRLLGPEGLWLAPLLLASQFPFLWQAQFGQIDMLVIALVTAQIALGVAAAEGAVRLWVSGAGLALLGTLGILAKGPVGCVPPWLVLLAWFAVRKDWQGLKRTGLLWAIPGVAALAGLWLLSIGLAAGWDYPQALLFKQTVQRYLEPWHHKAPWYYYLGVFWVQGLPWSLLVVPMAAQLVRKRGWREPAALLPLLWIAVYLLFFSVSEGKRSVYILPLYPALALLVAHGVLRWQSGAWKLRGFQGVILFLAGLFTALLVAVLLKPPAQALPFVALVLPGCGALVMAGVVAAVFAWRSRVTASVSAFSLGTLAFFLFTGLPVVKKLDAVKTPRPFARAAKPHIAAGIPLGVFPSLVPSVNYYCDSVTPVLGDKAAAEKFLAEGPPRMLLLQRDAWDGRLPGRAAVLCQAPIGDSHFVLLGVGIAQQGIDRTR